MYTFYNYSIKLAPLTIIPSLICVCEFCMQSYRPGPTWYRLWELSLFRTRTSPYWIRSSPLQTIWSSIWTPRMCSPWYRASAEHSSMVAHWLFGYRGLQFNPVGGESFSPFIFGMAAMPWLFYSMTVSISVNVEGQQQISSSFQLRRWKKPWLTGSFY